LYSPAQFSGDWNLVSIPSAPIFSPQFLRHQLRADPCLLRYFRSGINYPQQVIRKQNDF
jgi:hypothetical protein